MKPYMDTPADAPLPLDTSSLVQVLKHQLEVNYVILAGYLKVFSFPYASPVKLSAASHMVL